TPTAPPLEPLRPQAVQDPPIELSEELANVSLVVIQAPAANDRVDLVHQFRSRYRSLTPGTLSDLLLEVLNRLLPGIGVESARTDATTDLAGCQPQGPRATLDLVSQKLEADLHVNDARLIGVQRHAQRLQESRGLGQRTLRFRSCVTGDHPIVGIPRQPIASATHLPIKRSQKDVTEQGRDNTPLRCPLLGRQPLTIGQDPGFEHASDEAEHPTIRNALSHESQQLFMVHRPEKIFQIGVHDPFRPRVQLPPDLPQCILRRSSFPICEAGIIEHRLEHRFQPVQQRLLAHAIKDRRDTERPKLTRLTGLGDQLPSHRERLVCVRTQLLAELIELLVEHLLKIRQTLPVHTARPIVAPDPNPGQLQVLPLVDLIHQGVDLLRPGWIEPVRQSPRTFASGSFTHGTYPRARPCSSGVLTLTNHLCPPPFPAHPAADRSVTWLSPRLGYYAVVRRLDPHHSPLRLRL